MFRRLSESKMLSKLFTRLCLVVLCLQGALAAPDSESCVGSPKQFVQAFYDWYTPVIFHRHNVPAWEVAIKHRGQFFDGPLKAALNEDALAQARSPDEIVGLDTDPFVNSQDPVAHYAVAGTTSQKSGVLVHVKSWGEKPSDRGPAVDVELVCKDHSWKFTNFRYERDNLISLLARLKSARDAHRR